jgi:hypothetical protein
MPRHAAFAQNLQKRVFLMLKSKKVADETNKTVLEHLLGNADFASNVTN